MTTDTRTLPPVSHGEDLELRFQALVQSPLRAGLLRFLSSHRGSVYDVPALMQTFGRMRLDIENCLGELVTFGLVEQRTDTQPTRFTFRPPDQETVNGLLEGFLERRPAISHEDR